MKIIVFGLGNFGYYLSEELTNMGHEVIGIDINMNKIQSIKDKISHAICLDSTNPDAVKQLPITETDLAVVAIGEDEGASMLTTATLKLAGFSKVIARSISPAHDNVLEAMNIHEIVRPEQDSADRLARRLSLKVALEHFEIDKSYSIIEMKVPQSYIEQTLLAMNPRGIHRVNIVTIMRQSEKRNLLGIRKKDLNASGVINPEEVFKKDDVLVVFGSNEDLEKFIIIE